MKRIFGLFLIIALWLSVDASVFAARGAIWSDQICRIEGIIQSVEYHEAYVDPCVEKGNCPHTVPSYPTQKPARYYISVRINSVEYLSGGDSGGPPCKEQFPLNEETEIHIEEKQVKAGDSFEQGQRISGQVKWVFGSGNSFISYELL